MVIERIARLRCSKSGRLSQRANNTVLEIATSTDTKTPTDKDNQC
ncbi:Uncharacterised protein [Vibrio cholerae]|nr:Uncharacterised protein [Vibrio cholerae]